MDGQVKTLEQMLRELTPRQRDEVRDFVESLLTRQQNKQYGKPQFVWAGALGDLNDRYTSVDLQHQIARWRIQGE